MSGFPATTERLLADVDDGLFTRGAQVVVRHRGEEVLSLAYGEAGAGLAMAPDTLLRVYCAIKPVTAIAVAQLVDEGRLDLDEPLAGRLPGVRALDDGLVRLRHLLSHTAGMHRPGAVEVELLPVHRRAAAVDEAGRQPGWRVGADAAYSEFPAWHLLGRLLESVTGRPLGEHLRETVLDPLGMADTFIGMTTEQYAANLHRLGVNLAMAGPTPVPLLLERGERMCTEVNVAHGGYSTAADLARFYVALNDRLLGRDAPDAVPSVATLRTFTTAARPPTYDQVLDRECSYGLGFMTPLHEHAFGSSPSAEAFGHSGMAGGSFGWADPAHDLAVGVVLNGVVDPASAFLRRPVLVRAVYADLAELEGEGVDAATGPDADPVDAGATRNGGRRFRWGRRR